MRADLSNSLESILANDPPVVVSRMADEPKVRGKLKPRLTYAQFNVVRALLEAGDDGLTKDELDTKSGHTEARKILKRLHDSDPDWAEVIQMPGIPGRRYRIV